MHQKINFRTPPHIQDEDRESGNEGDVDSPSNAM